MKTTRCWTLLFALLMAADFVNPDAPGFFSFDSPNLFVDATVDLTGELIRAMVPVVPVPTPQSVRADDSPRVPSVASIARLQLVRQILRAHTRRDEPAVSAPSAPEDG